jgi:predicted enzyme related to lactoylglutathione lyase
VIEDNSEFNHNAYIIHPSIGAVFVPVSDIVKSGAWYARLLGVIPPELSHQERICDLPLANNQKLILDSHGAVANSSQPLCFFWSDDIAAAEAWLKQAGIETLGAIADIGSVKTLVFVDPDGNRLMVCQRNT